MYSTEKKLSEMTPEEKLARIWQHFKDYFPGAKEFASSPGNAKYRNWVQAFTAYDASVTLQALRQMDNELGVGKFSYPSPRQFHEFAQAIRRDDHHSAGLIAKQWESPPISWNEFVRTHNWNQPRYQTDYYKRELPKWRRGAMPSLAPVEREPGEEG